ncbi:Inosine/uridine-preferring nucleoside hydrolase domain-containing protein [Gautieria morchelliformis]|nr:Inosine/uridine-preferring nucleoside hydrolase domain-containing protein [Gautieria morchelliformis]
MERIIWLDADPVRYFRATKPKGHDDAIAILLALNCPQVKLLGISTVHGNASPHDTWKNAVRLLYAFGAPMQGPHAYAGATKPLIREAKQDPEIHGADGLGGVEGLPEFTDPLVQARLQQSGNTRAIEAMAKAIQEMWNGGRGQRTTLVTTGPQTNLALFLSLYTDLEPAIEEIIFMGGGLGLGNRSAVAEYNILCDPEASQIVLNFPVRKVMIPINVTHQAILTRSIHARLLSPHAQHFRPSDLVPQPLTPLRHTLSTLLTYFAEAYKSTFGFEDGPPLHDALTIAYIARPELFRCQRYRVDVELAGLRTAGETVVDVWNYGSYDGSWGRLGQNCLVAMSIDVPGFFDLLLEAVRICDQISPLNAK